MGDMTTLHSGNNPRRLPIRVRPNRNESFCSPRHWKRCGLTVLIIVAAFFFSCLWTYNMTERNRQQMFGRAKEAIENNDVAGVYGVLAEWCRLDPECTRDDRYAASLAEAGRIARDPTVIEHGKAMTVNNVMAQEPTTRQERTR